MRIARPLRFPLFGAAAFALAMLVAPAGPSSAASPPPASAAPAAQTAAEPALRFEIREGRVLNAFLRERDVAAHLLLSDGEAPRLLVTFPAGNSGAGLWFERGAEPVRWRLLGDVRPLHERDARGRPLRGIEVGVETDARQLVLREAVLGSVRVLRDYQLGGRQPEQGRVSPRIERGTLRWARDRLDGAPGYVLELGLTAARAQRDPSGALTLHALDDRPLRLQLRALTGDAPLMPLTASHLLNDTAGADARSRQALEFLSYREKFLAGSWRFDTYFGRDTLMSLRLLLPALQPEAADAALASVLARLSPQGEVAHEEDIGEFAVLRRLREQGAQDDTPIYDYAMIDDDFMLAPVAAAWLLDDPRGRSRATAFLAASDADGRRHGDALARNVAYVLQRTQAFDADPSPDRLVGLHAGRMAGQWRDSNEGLGRGRYPYDVNAVLVPAALRASEALARSGLLDPYLAPPQRTAALAASTRAERWERRVASWFEVSRPAASAAAQIRAYAARVGVPPTAALASLQGRPLQFHALALDAEGRPVPVLHSDDGFLLLFARPSPVVLERVAAAALRPFPAGLATDIGLLVANPAFAGEDAWARFDNTAYHGTVVWAWQQALWAAGLDRQLARDDLPATTRQRLQQARRTLWRAIRNADAVRTSELWSWSYADGAYRIEPFGARGADADESNAAQLWSTVFLALKPPADDAAIDAAVPASDGDAERSTTPEPVPAP